MKLPLNSLGQKGESQAKKLLLNKGYRFIAANYATRYGEIDLIFQDHNQLVFVEVKARSSDALGHPEEAITPKKIEKISQVGEYFMQTHPELPQFARIDVVAIENNQVHYLKNISI